MSDQLRERLTKAIDRFKYNLAFTAPEAWHERVDQLHGELLDVADDLGSDHEHWAVAYGGEDPNECAGVSQYDDDAAR